MADSLVSAVPVTIEWQFTANTQTFPDNHPFLYLDRPGKLRHYWPQLPGALSASPYYLVASP